MQDDGFNVLTRVGPGTLMGNLFRRFWLPALLSSELPEPDGTPIRLRILSEDLVAFRDSDGKVGIVGAYCPTSWRRCFSAATSSAASAASITAGSSTLTANASTSRTSFRPTISGAEGEGENNELSRARGRWHRMGLYGTARAHARVARDGMANTAAKSPSCLKMVSPQQLAAGCRR